MLKILVLLCVFCLPVYGLDDQPPAAAVPLTDEVQGDEIDETRDTPEACYRAFRAAWNEGDFESALSYFTPKGRKTIVATHGVYIGLWQEMGTAEMHNSEFGLALKKLLSDRGIRDLGELFVQIKKDLVPPGEDDEAFHVSTLLKLAEHFGEPVSFISELSELDRELNDRREFRLRFGTLTDVSVNGITAEGWQSAPGLVGELSVDFRLTDQGWMIDTLFPYPVPQPGGNRYREKPGDGDEND